MDLFPSDYHRMFFTSPMERMMARVFGDSLRGMGRSFSSVRPYWLEQPTLQECNIGNALGKVINDHENFAVEVNVSQFRPEELSVNVRENQLVVEGHHEERSDAIGQIERHFVRKYTIPEDVNPETIESHLSDKGVLSIGAKKMTIGQPTGRTIPIQTAPRQKDQAELEKKEESQTLEK